MQGSLIVLMPLLLLAVIVLTGLPIGLYFVLRERAAQVATGGGPHNGASPTPKVITKGTREKWDWSDALRVRDVNALASSLLERIGVPVASQSKKLAGEVRDLKRVLEADYREASGLPQRRLLRELAQIVDSKIADKGAWAHWDDLKSYGELAELFGPPEIVVRGEGYRRGLGLELLGFCCRGKFGGETKTLIWLNTAHHPSAVAAVFGHELGHYVYECLIGGDEEPLTTFFEGSLSKHLDDKPELFADALVALAAYKADQIKLIIGDEQLYGAASNDFLERAFRIHELMMSSSKIKTRPLSPGIASALPDDDDPLL